VAVTGYDVFLSYTWGDLDLVGRVQAALEAEGLTVFRDVDNPLFDGITDGLTAALDASKVLLAVYSRRYPTRYACQWELTRAFLAGQVVGDPRDRVLVVNPEPDESHIVPVHLEDAGYFAAAGSDPDLTRLAKAVRAKVKRADRPIGACRPTGVPGLPQRVLGPRRFVGRYPSLWQIHSALHAVDVPMIRAPTPCPAVVVKGFAGTGKTSLAEQYAFLFRDAFPGGVHWIDLAGADPVAEFSARLRRIAGQEMGLDVHSASRRRVRSIVAGQLDEDARKVLFVLDDLAPGVDPSVVEQLLVPSAFARTVITSRVAPADWPGPLVEPGGMTATEAEQLFAEEWRRLDDTDRAAIARLVERSGGHPFVLRAAFDKLRNSQGFVAKEVDAFSASVVDVLRQLVRAATVPARTVLAAASTLSAVPFDGLLLADALEGTDVGDALGELDKHNLLQRLDRVGGPAARQSWTLHALVAEAVRAEVTKDELAELAKTVADRLIRSDRYLNSHLHAREVAQRQGLAASQRVALLRSVTRHYESTDDLVGAWSAAELLARRDPGVDDLLTIARIAISVGRYDDAERYARQGVAKAESDDNYRAEYRARILVAQACEQLGRYAAADEVFHAHRGAMRHGLAPPWMPVPERHSTLVSRAASRRLRGDYTGARKLLTELMPELSSGPDGAWPAAMVELTRALLLTSEIRKARVTGARVVALFDELGRREHPLYLQAVGLQAEAEMQVALTEMKSREADWQSAAEKIEAVHSEHVRKLGEDNPVTLGFAVAAGWATLGRGRAKTARKLFVDAEERIVRALGPRHPLVLRVRHGVGLAHCQLSEYERARVVLADVLDQHVAALGRLHPDSLTLRLALGMTCLATGRRAEGIELVEEAERELDGQFGWSTELAFRAKVTRLLSHLPGMWWTAFIALAGRFDSRDRD
jgi:tetratricopeptide (TPR) repeat protein